ncbi:MAG: type II toxin-antitoxin system HicA family toxin [Euryarchaeota archaeon]|nr:type II toxin-antitoxin system HicA family toxin [Euryarchaeota archaeon]
MNEKLPRITAGKVTRVLEKVGFVLVRQSGSHKIYKNSEGRSTLPLKKGSSPQGLEEYS